MQVTTHVSDLERTDKRRTREYGATQRVSVILTMDDEFAELRDGTYQAPSVLSRLVTLLWGELRARHKAGTFPSFCEGYGSSTLDTYTHTEQGGRRAYWITFSAWIPAERPSEIVDQDEALALMGGVDGLQELVESQLEAAKAAREAEVDKAAVLQEAQHILTHYAKELVAEAVETCRFEARLAGLVAEAAAEAQVKARAKLSELREEGSITYADTDKQVRPEAFRLICEHLEAAVSEVSPLPDSGPAFFDSQSAGEAALPELPEDEQPAVH